MATELDPPPLHPTNATFPIRRISQAGAHSPAEGDSFSIRRPNPGVRIQPPAYLTTKEK